MATITIYLLRENIKAAEDAIAENAAMHIVSDGQSEYGKLFVKQTPARPPKWAKFFDRFVDRKSLGTVQSTAAVFIVSTKNRFFAITFGHGRFILKPDAYEERFGLLVTLNSVKSDALRSIDKRTFVDDQNSRIQTSQASAALDFGVDIERDLIRGIVGLPSIENLGRKLAGTDALAATIDAEVPDFKRILRRYLKAFQSKAYQAQFPWVDQVRQLHPRGQTVEELNALLVEKLNHAWTNNGIVDDCWLSVPDIVDWSVVYGFKFTRSRREGVSSDLHLPGLVQAFPNDTPSIEFLRAHHAMAVNEDEMPVERWPVFRCIHCEIQKEDKSFFLSAGHWFEVDRSFVRSVDDFVSSIKAYPDALPIYDHKDEDAYNKSIASGGNGKWCLMDKKNVHVGGIHDKVEFCDVYGDQLLLHIKHYGSSSVLGHLFNQGLVSGELLKSHPNFVQLVNKKLDSTHQLFLGDAVPRDVSEYKVVFGIISQSAKPGLHLPFFAKVVLKSVCTRLRDLGYGDIMLAKIDCDPMVVLKKKLRSKGPRKRKT